MKLTPIKMAQKLCASLASDAGARKVKGKADSALCTWIDANGTEEGRVKFVAAHEDDDGNTTPALAYVTLAVDPTMVVEMLTAAGVVFNDMPAKAKVKNAESA